MTLLREVGLSQYGKAWAIGPKGRGQAFGQSL